MPFSRVLQWPCKTIASEPWSMRAGWPNSEFLKWLHPQSIITIWSVSKLLGKSLFKRYCHYLTWSELKSLPPGCMWKTTNKDYLISQALTASVGANKSLDRKIKGDVPWGLWKDLIYYQGFGSPHRLAGLCACEENPKVPQSLISGWSWGPVQAGSKGKGRIIHCLSITGVPEHK